MYYFDMLRGHLNFRRMASYIALSITLIVLHNVMCICTSTSYTFNHVREKRTGTKCGHDDLLSRCRSDVNVIDEGTFVLAQAGADITRQEAYRYCPSGTHVAEIKDAFDLDEVASIAFKDRDRKYWVDVTSDLENALLYQASSCTCYSNNIELKYDESTIMEVKRNEYKIKKKESRDKGMMRGVVCQKDEVITARPQTPTSKAYSTKSPITNTLTPVIYAGTDYPVTENSFDWIIFLLSVIAITLIISVLIGCVICCKIKSKKQQNTVNQTVSCTVQPNTGFEVNAIPSAPPAYEPSVYKGLSNASEINPAIVANNVPPGVYASYEVPMDNPPAMTKFQQPNGLYNGSTGYMEIDSGPNVNNQSTEYNYDELQINTTQAPEYTYAYADRKSISQNPN